jgi:hypothetical protein
VVDIKVNCEGMPERHQEAVSMFFGSHSSPHFFDLLWQPRMLHGKVLLSEELR